MDEHKDLIYGIDKSTDLEYVEELKQRIEKLEKQISEWSDIWVCDACKSRNASGRVNCFKCGRNVYE